MNVQPVEGKSTSRCCPQKTATKTSKRSGKPGVRRIRSRTGHKSEPNPTEKEKKVWRVTRTGGGSKYVSAKGGQRKKVKGGIMLDRTSKGRNLQLLKRTKEQNQLRTINATGREKTREARKATSLTQNKGKAPKKKVKANLINETTRPKNDDGMGDIGQQLRRLTTLFTRGQKGKEANNLTERRNDRKS